MAVRAPMAPKDLFEKEICFSSGLHLAMNFIWLEKHSSPRNAKKKLKSSFSKFNDLSIQTGVCWEESSWFNFVLLDLQTNATIPRYDS